MVSDGNSGRVGGHRRLLILFTALIVAAALSLLLTSLRRSPEHALSQLPAEKRHAAYLATIHLLESVCAGEIAPELEEYCRGQANFALQFPECDQRCRDLANPVLEHLPRAR